MPPLRTQEPTLPPVATSPLDEASRLAQASREERRRAEILVQCAHVLHASLERGEVLDTLAQHVQLLLRARLVAVVVQEGHQNTVQALYTDPPEIAEQVRTRHREEGSSWFDDLLRRTC